MNRKKLAGYLTLAALLALPAVAHAGLIEDLLNICRYLTGQSCGGIDPGP
jgi:hypothetical protein